MDYKTERQGTLQDWAMGVLVERGLSVPANFRIESASDDASFRRYFRCSLPGYIFVDAPPDKEDNSAFLLVQGLLSAAEISVPEVYASDLELGFLALSDLGDQLLLPILQSEDPASWYKRAVAEVARVQRTKTTGLPDYSETKLREEMGLFPTWFIQQQSDLNWDSELEKMFSQVTDLMVSSALQQPKVFVHRDFHARNLMLSEQGEFSVIDFQDAVSGPVTYDLVSLLKDCYFRLPRRTVEALVAEFRVEHCSEVNEGEFLRWFDFMGFQRHLKCAGIFSRLNIRDGKPGYLKDIPLVVSYLQEVCGLYSELESFGLWLDQSVKPKVQRL